MRRLATYLQPWRVYTDRLATQIRTYANASPQTRAEGVVARVCGAEGTGTELETAIRTLLNGLQPRPGPHHLQDLLKDLRLRNEPQRCMAVFKWAQNTAGLEARQHSVA